MKTAEAFRAELAHDTGMQQELVALVATGAGMDQVVAFAAGRGFDLASVSFAEVELSDLELELVAGGKLGFGRGWGGGWGGGFAFRGFWF